MDGQSRAVMTSTDPRVQAALLDYFQRTDRGEAFDVGEFLTGHASVADELRSLIAFDVEARRMAAHSATTQPLAPQPQAEVSTHSLGHGSEGTRPGANASGPTTELPEHFGKYRVVRKLGAGMMGAVYLAEDTRLHRLVALKTPTFDRDDGGELLRRFHREARAVSRIKHPHLCAVYDVDELDGRHYIAMEFVPGCKLSDCIVADVPMAEVRAIELVRKIALGMQSAHNIGVLHRDLKPDNIMVNELGDPVVMDFGLVHRIDAEDSTVITRHGTLIGSPAYMSKEQVEGDPDKLTPATDQYSLGVILFQLLTSQRPFVGGLYVVLDAIVNKATPPPSRLRPDIDPRLDQLCLKMMSKRAEDRFPSMSAVAEALEQIAAELKAAPCGMSPASESSLVSGPHERHPLVRRVILTVLVLGPLAFLCLLPQMMPGLWLARREQPGTASQPESSRAVRAVATPTSPETEEDSPPPAPIPVDFALNRHAAEWIIGRGGQAVIEANGTRIVARRVDDLPTDDFLLKEIELHGGPAFDESEFGVLTGLSDLEAALLWSSPIGDDAVTHLARVGSLRRVHLTETGVTDLGVQRLSRLPRLEHLILDATKTTEACYPDLARLTRLTQFDLGHLPFSSKVPALIESLPNLETLNVHHDWANDETVRHLIRRESLAAVGLTGNTTPAEVAALRPLPRLYSIYFTKHTALSREVLRELRHFSPLHRVGFTQCRVVSDDMDAITECPGITKIALMFSPFRDEHLAALTKLKMLDELHVLQTAITPKGIALIRRAFPNCRITGDVASP